MARYIIEDPHPEELFPEEACEQFLERGRCLLQLLSQRRSFRLVCAPAAYGKTALAFQYAHLAFELKNVAWVDASDFLFLCALDARTAHDPLKKYGLNSLVVFDNIPELDDERAEAFAELNESLRQRRCETLALTRIPDLADRWAERSLVLRGIDLALDENELAESGASCISSHQGRSLLSAGACLGGHQGQERFFRSLAAPRALRTEEKLALMALVIGPGKIADLEKFCGPADKDALGAMSANFPYASASTRAGRYIAAPLSVARRVRLFEAHAAALAKKSPFSSEDALASALAEHLRRAGEDEAAQELEKCFRGQHGQGAARCAPFKSSEVPARALRPQNRVSDDAPTMRWGSTRLPEVGVPPDDNAPFEIAVFGRFSIVRAGRPVPPVGEVRKMGKLLIALMLVNHNKELPRKWVQNALWPDTAETAARSSYYSLWNYVRRLFVPDGEAFARLPRSKAVVSLASFNIRSDVQAFDALRARAQSCRGLHDWERLLDMAARLYRGPLLPGIDNVELESFRSAYANKMIDLLLGGIDSAMRAGQLGVALRFATRAFELDPAREDVCYRYMDIQKRLGQLAGAVSTFLGCRRALVDRFGLEGSSRLEALYREILREME